MAANTSVNPGQVLAYRTQAQQLDRDGGSVADTALLDLGAQDTGTDGGLWALRLRGLDASADAAEALVTVWTLRGAPHLYRLADLPSVAAAVSPYSEADAAKRIFDAAKPLREAGISALAGLDIVAERLREIVQEPMVKGDVSRELSARLDPPFLRWCRPCQATHCYEMPFRLGALRAGLRLRPGTSPPVLEPIPGFQPAEALPQHDPIRTYLRLLGPATPPQVAGYIDAALKEVKARWPEDAVQVAVGGRTAWVLLAHERALVQAETAPTRLLGPYDLFLQARDRDVLVADPGRAKALWPVLGRPGALLLGGALAGLWRPRQTSGTLNLTVTPWQALGPAQRSEVASQAERLAQFRGVRLGGVTFQD